MEKAIAIFEISTLEYAEMQKIVQNKQTKSILGSKLPYLDILGSKFEKVLSYLKSAVLWLDHHKINAIEAIWYYFQLLQISRQ